MSLSKDNFQRVIRDVHEETAHALRVIATITGVDINVTAITDSIKIGDELGNYATITEVGSKNALDVVVQDISISHTNDSIQIGDGTDTLVINSDGSINTKIPEHSVLIDKASSDITYVGQAAVGTLSSQSLWSIMKITTSGSITSVHFANSSESATNIWNDRLTLTYG